MVKDYDFSGVWRSTYNFRSSTREGEQENVHYLTIQRKGNQIIAQSLSTADANYMLARFSLDGRIATGSWQEEMSPQGYYKGTIYHGAAQLIMDDDGNALRGQWVGFGENMEVKTGKWEIERLHHNEAITKKHIARKAA